MNNKLRISILIAFIILITLLHNISTMEDPLFLNLYQRLYYIPIVLAAYWFGLKGALITSIVSTLSYPHHGHYHWPDHPFYTMNQYAEMMMFNLIAIVTGVLSDLETRQRKKYEQASYELEEAYQKLQDSFEHVRRQDRLSALGELSAAMAHEIRNPLGSIKGGIDIIEDDFDKNSKKYEFFQIIKKEISRLDTKISEFLNYARPSPPQMSKSRINDVITSIVRLVEKRAEQQGIEIYTNLDSGIPETVMDSEQIKQALLNVILNAIQALQKGGRISIKSWVEENRICVSIRDTGKGIPKDNLSKLFDPFFTTKEDGTGLGLSISYQILKAHEGDIEVIIPEGGGCEFDVYLPLKESEK